MNLLKGQKRKGGGVQGEPVVKVEAVADIPFEVEEVHSRVFHVTLDPEFKRM